MENIGGRSLFWYLKLEQVYTSFSTKVWRFYLRSLSLFVWYNWIVIHLFIYKIIYIYNHSNKVSNILLHLVFCRFSFEALQESAHYLLERTSIRPRIGIICGSGLSKNFLIKTDSLIWWDITLVQNACGTEFIEFFKCAKTRNYAFFIDVPFKPRLFSTRNQILGILCKHYGNR